MVFCKHLCIALELSIYDRSRRYFDLSMKSSKISFLTVRVVRAGGELAPRTPVDGVPVDRVLVLGYPLRPRFVEPQQESIGCRFAHDLDTHQEKCSLVSSACREDLRVPKRLGLCGIESAFAEPEADQLSIVEETLLHSYLLGFSGPFLQQVIVGDQ